MCLYIKYLHIKAVSDFIGRLFLWEDYHFLFSLANQAVISIDFELKNGLNHVLKEHNIY